MASVNITNELHEIIKRMAKSRMAKQTLLVEFLIRDHPETRKFVEEQKAIIDPEILRD